MSREEAEGEIKKACDIYREVTGREPESSAAPGWACSPDQLAIQDSLPMRYHSDSRGECPFFPIMNGKHFSHLQIPTTLPTLDELLGSGECSGGDELSRYYIGKITTGPSHVLTIHAEAEGMGWAEWFDKLLGELASKGVAFKRLREIADTALTNPSNIPRCNLTMGELPGRAGRVAVQGKTL
jgi:peptidoglycan/xylan/chitin deacetylase (PgdA/CDA1 family)